MTTALGPTALPLSHVEHCMGTVFSVLVKPPGVERSAVDDAVAWLHLMDAMFSTYRRDSEICRIDDGRLRVAHASPEVRDVLDVCAILTDATDGYFSARPDGERLDPSGYVKGWAVQHVADLLTAAGSRNHCVNGGGDVACVGRPVAGRGWRIGITDPHRPGRLLTSVAAVGPLAVATSGLAERGAHILDPHTGRAVSSTASATVIASDLVTADVWATAGVAMGPERAARRLAEQPGLRALLISDGGAVDYVGDWDPIG